MKAIILSAGQGRRLLPHTRALPKCLLSVHGGRSMLELQLQTLAACGVERATVMTGFGFQSVEEALADIATPGLEMRTEFNPFYATSDNLITTWVARAQMDEDFLLLNGDTLFEAEVLRRLLAAETAPICLAVDRKSSYDDDDMKVALGAGSRVLAIAKKLESHEPAGEAIGMTLFRGAGVEAFREALDAAVRREESVRAWYPSVLSDLAKRMPIRAVSIHGLWWSEIDCPADLESVRAALRRRAARERESVAAKHSAGLR